MNQYHTHTQNAHVIICDAIVHSGGDHTKSIISQWESKLIQLSPSAGKYGT
ncbi:MAG: hypothetical protein J07HQW2_00985 [Haloquadratum walsbyi J07HQW2]|uniref:Uncharacterized protein n=1 Tax=Haloquadratum walsbyi J07HQW2 TaxID=1238425 RepID=U1MVV9_9EURY|nr:MAG: hypothetical protein J07HQW2_00985 [Haloquadratum walsbyi J07HQW2]